MIIKRLQGRGAAEIKLEVRNVDGAGSLTQNSPVCILVDGNSVNGLNAGQPAAVNFKAWVGVADKTIAINAYGLSKAWGYINSVKISEEGSSVTITASDAIFPIAGTDLGVNSVGGATLAYTNMVYGILAETITLSAGQYAKAQLRCL